MFDFLKKIFGSKQDRDIQIYQPLIDNINKYYNSYTDLSNDELRNKTVEFKARIAEHLLGVDQDINALKEQANQSDISLLQKEQLYDQIDDLTKTRDKHLEDVLKAILPEAFAVVRETSRRFSTNSSIEVTATDHDRSLSAKGKSYITLQGDKAYWANEWTAAGGHIKWNMVHYNVQLIGGMVLHDGKIAEMATGEGKTLVATLPAYLNGLSGQGMHVITVNDYLARRDSEWIGPIFEFLLLTVDCIDKYKPHTPERIRAYKADITYGTNNEFGFDYLRDNMVVNKDEKVQAKHHFAMVDEVDSVLIDDARTPLIISGPVPEGADEQEYHDLNPKIEGLYSNQRKLVTDLLTQARKLFQEGKAGYEEGQAGMALLRAHRALPKYRPLIKFLSEDGVKAMLQRTENYYLQEQQKNMPIVDKELFFTIEEKTRSVELTDKGSVYLAKGENDENFFVLPDIVKITQDIDNQEKAEGIKLTDDRTKLINEYAMKSRRLHSVQQLLKAYTLFDKDQEYVVVEGQVKIVDEQTGRMMEGRRYSDGLHQALEAKEKVDIGNITQTYATITLQNYFRMYHKLAGMTGTAETEAGEFWEIYKLDVVVIPTNRPITRKDLEDKIYKTAREKFNAVIDDINSLTSEGRPVLVGTTSVEISELLSRMLNLRGIKHQVLNAKLHQKEAEIVAEAGKAGSVTIATNMAGRGTDIKITEEVRQAGGLAIIATERHDSRRVDRQLRGRSGRQGDPGSSQFYVSLEDNLMRLFQSDRIATMMDKLGHKEGEVLQASMLTKSIERAQKKVEENNFGIRKRLLEYDDVMNIQRDAIYRKRNNALSGERLAVDIYNMFEAMITSIAYDAKKDNDYAYFRNECLTRLSEDPTISEQEFKSYSAEQVVSELLQQCISSYDVKKENLKQIIYPIVERVVRENGDRFRRLAVPYVDGSMHPLPIATEIAEAMSSKGQSIPVDLEKAITLALIDDKWKEHLRAMDELKDSVQSASFEQKDPLVIYKMEAYNLFENLVHTINRDVVAYLMRGELVFQNQNTEEQQLKAAKEVKTDLSKVSTNKEQEARRAAAESAGAPQERRSVETIVRNDDKIGRNDPCPCGSGKKYKNCHG
jgi:preprotein translocase subunit SecA